MEYGIEQLIPQRAPIRMVDCLLEADAGQAVTGFVVREDNCFLEDGRLAEAGVMEHIAQSASALAGYIALSQGATRPPVGYIGEIKNFRCLRCPRVGEELRTTVVTGARVGGISLIQGEARVGGELVATTQMKIFIHPNDRSGDVSGE